MPKTLIPVLLLGGKSRKPVERSLKVLFRIGGVALLVVVAVTFLPWTVARLQAPSRTIRLVHVVTEGPPPQKSAGDFTVLTWNIAHGRGLAPGNWSGGDASARRLRLQKIAETIRFEGPDVVVLNEVDFNASWSDGVNQAQRIAARAGYPWVIEQRNLDFALGPFSWRFGNAILSRHPVAEIELLELPAHNSWETLLAGHKRGVLATVMKDDVPIKVAALHLEHRREAVRVQGAHAVLDLLRAAGKESANDSIPTVLAGDLNSAPKRDPAHATDANGENAFTVLVEAGDLKAMSAGRTFPADSPRFVIDWILATPSLRFERYEVIPTLESDHRPVLAAFAFAERAGPRGRRGDVVLPREAAVLAPTGTGVAKTNATPPRPAKALAELPQIPPRPRLPRTRTKEPLT